MSDCCIQDVPIASEAIWEQNPICSYREGSVRTRTYVEQALASLRLHARPRLLYRRLPFTAAQRCLENAPHWTTRKIPATLRHCPDVLVFLISLGSKMDAVIREVQKRNQARAMVLDRVASAAVETAVQHWRAHVQARLPGGAGVTLPYSPGYCDWPLAAQRSLFDLFPPRPLGVSLSAHQAMTPRKSTTGIMGIGDVDTIRKHGNACRSCPRRGCSFRRGKE